MTSINPIVTNAATTSPCCGPSGCGTGTPPTHGAGTASAREVNEFGDPTGRNADGTVAPSVDLMAWIAANRHLMVPPVGNKYLYSGKDFFVMIIAGPNARNDFHMTNSEEFFIQLKGDIVVRIREGGTIRDVPVREGETFFIPPNVPHSPQRGPDTLGLVVERRRPETETEHLMFFCEKCGELVYDKEFICRDIVQHFAKAMEEFWADPKLNTCRCCGTQVKRPF
jgi:3-hydroxyanthranilate 3,4-dioxygenase